ncbi:unnamed protein product [Arctia plantaginis]|uniref:Uncharacterized protein n=1 Tax=Arctia plantaginis TaxID=874455 RepID=A0A8S0ZGJ5_ARCPL|nr:unnamed protein product [Arctia plantaginis]
MATWFQVLHKLDLVRSQAKIFHTVDAHRHHQLLCSLKNRITIQLQLLFLCALYGVFMDADYQLKCAWCEIAQWFYEKLFRMDDYVDRKMDDIKL